MLEDRPTTAESSVIGGANRAQRRLTAYARARMLLLYGGWRRGTSYDIVRNALALLLLIAAALKAYQLATAPVREIDLFSSRWFLVVTVEFELALGIWLIGGQSPRQTRLVAFGCFAALGGVSLFRAFRGDSSCGCFGSVEVSPWLVAIVDAGAAAALLSCTPSKAAKGQPQSYSQY